MARHNVIGKEGEDVATEYLRENGWEIVERNYRRNYGEIDIVARETGGKLVFVEVKTVSYETPGYRPEENIHPQKLRRLSRTIESYILSHRIDGDWRFDVIAVFLNPATRQAKIRHTEDVIIGA